jgi:hypothetical protein
MRVASHRHPVFAALLGSLATLAILAGAALAANTIRSIDIVNGSVGTADLKNSDVRSIDIRNANVLAADIRAGAVTSSKLADGSVTSAKLADAGISGVDIADASIASADIADGAVATADLADGSVTPAKLAPLEAWHTVGAANEPAFENNWGQYVTIPVTYRKDRDGMVHMLGIATRATCSTPTTLFTLPVGYRPAAYNGYAVVTSTNVLGADTIAARLSISSDGRVVMNDGQCGMVFFGHISFPAA